jgi:hypothetical protein
VPNTATASEARFDHRENSLASSDLWLEGFAIFNFLCLTGDVTLAHSENRFRVHAEYIPLWFSLVAGIALALALFVRVKRNSLAAWNVLGYLVGWVSITVGTAGIVYHLESQFFHDRTIRSLVYAAPFAAPAAYIGLGCLIVMNRMVAPREKEWAQWVLFLTLGGFAGNFVLSLTDHAANGFFHWTEWIPVISSAFAVGFLAALLFLDTAGPILWLYAGILMLEMAVGVLGFALHIWADLHGPEVTLLANVISGAPPLAPLLLPNLSILGFIGVIAMAREAHDQRSVTSTA